MVHRTHFDVPRQSLSIVSIVAIQINERALTIAVNTAIGDGNTRAMPLYEAHSGGFFFDRAFLPMPNIKDQSSIANHFNLKEIPIDTLITKIERSIALITADVTGQIDLRETA